MPDVPNSLDRAFTKDAALFADRYFAQVFETLSRIDRSEVARFVTTLLDARERGALIFFIGNGGSAATASHFANDLANGTRSKGKPFRACSFTDNVSVMTAIANDSGYEHVFVGQLRTIAQPGDVLVAISASGNSPNLIAALEYGSGSGLRTVAITSFDGGRMKNLAAQCVHVPTEQREYGLAEDAHLILNHVVGNYLMRLLQHE